MEAYFNFPRKLTDSFLEWYWHCRVFLAALGLPMQLQHFEIMGFAGAPEVPLFHFFTNTRAISEYYALFAFMPYVQRLRLRQHFCCLALLYCCYACMVRAGLSTASTFQSASAFVLFLSRRGFLVVRTSAPGTHLCSPRYTCSSVSSSR